jgi:hypothetical protein
MKKILRGAVAPAFVVAIIQFLVEFLFPVTALTQSFEAKLRLTFVMMALADATLLVGAGLYALRLRRRSGASLAACVVGGAAVGLLASLTSQLAKSVLLCLGLAVLLSQVPGVPSAVWTVILTVMSFACLVSAIWGLIVGEIGGGLVGVLSAWRSGQSMDARASMGRVDLS